MTATPRLLSGVAFALGAGLIWGVVFVTPLILPEYPGIVLAFGRYLAFGLIALPIGWQARHRLRSLTRADWLEALRLSFVGNLLYYSALATAIQLAGAPLPTMVIGTLPVVIAIVSNLGERAVSWHRLAPSLVVIAVGIALVNRAELRHLANADGDLLRYAAGAAVAVLATACWTWYPIRNARWLRSHAAGSAATWATAQGLATLPLGPDPWRFVGWMLALGLLASWLGTLWWNAAARRLPTSLAGQLIVFETLSALAYAWGLRRAWPDPATLAGVMLLVAGVVLGVGAFARAQSRAKAGPGPDPAAARQDDRAPPG